MRVFFAADAPPTTFVTAATTTTSSVAEEVARCTETAVVLAAGAVPMEVEKVQ